MSYPQYQMNKKQSSKLPLTGSDILGPFYRPGSPFVHNLGSVPPELVLTGRVLDQSGNPVIRNCYIEFWQADKNGKYDEAGPGFRGIQHINYDSVPGAYRLETVHPGAYDISDPNAPQPHEFRCSHIHVKIWIDGVDVLTTQLYFANDPYDATDHWFNAEREIKFTSPGVGSFDFVVAG